MAKLFFDSSLAKDNEGITVLDSLASSNVEGLDRTGSICRDLVLHLHGLEDEKNIASLDALANIGNELHNLARHRSIDGVLTGTSSLCSLRSSRSSSRSCLGSCGSRSCLLGSRSCASGLYFLDLNLISGAIDSDVEFFH